VVFCHDLLLRGIGGCQAAGALPGTIADLTRVRCPRPEGWPTTIPIGYEEARPADPWATLRPADTDLGAAATSSTGHFR